MIPCFVQVFGKWVCAKIGGPKHCFPFGAPLSPLKRVPSENHTPYTVKHVTCFLMCFRKALQNIQATETTIRRLSPCTLRGLTVVTALTTLSLVCTQQANNHCENSHGPNSVLLHRRLLCACMLWGFADSLPRSNMRKPTTKHKAACLRSD